MLRRCLARPDRTFGVQFLPKCNAGQKKSPPYSQNWEVMKHFSDLFFRERYKHGDYASASFGSVSTLFSSDVFTIFLTSFWVLPFAMDQSPSFEN